MNEITVIILTYNEEIHIERCVSKAMELTDNIIVVDSFSTDNTVRIAERLGAKVYQNSWPGNQASQFNWALDNIIINSNWILRLDADEYLLPELVREINENISDLDESINGVVFNRRLIFQGKWLKRGAYPNPFLRLFRKGYARSEERLMDEHIVLSKGEVVTFNNDFVDHNLDTLDKWHQKHLDYSNRELFEHYRMLYLSDNSISSSKKIFYNRMPLFFRCFVYFIFRYFFKGGFIEGKESFLWNFYQGFWYRFLVDTKIWIWKKNKTKEEILRIIENRI